MKPEIVEELARAICTAASDEAGLCWRDDDPHPLECVQSCVACRNVARACWPLIDRLVSEAREEGRQEMVDAYISAMRTAKGSNHA